MVLTLFSSTYRELAKISNSDKWSFCLKILTWILVFQTTTHSGLVWSHQLAHVPHQPAGGHRAAEQQPLLQAVPRCVTALGLGCVPNSPPISGINRLDKNVVLEPILAMML